MGTVQSIKNLVSRTISDVWNVLLGRRPESYRIPEVGAALIEQVDHALFERKLEKAIVSGVVLDKWAENDLHFECKSSAVLSSVYAVCGLGSLAEERIMKAKGLIQPECDDCKAHYLKRLGTYHIYQKNLKPADKAFSRSIDLFIRDGNIIEAGKSMLNRGVARAIMDDLVKGLADEEQALELLGDEFSIHIIAATVNLVSMLAQQERFDEAFWKIEEVHGMLVGEHNLERPKLILRWIKALLYETQEKLRHAADMMDRIEPRMLKLDMKPELKVLYADQARMVKRTETIKQIARKAYDLEDLPSIRTTIKSVIDGPSPDNLMKWRNSLDAYVPPFPATA